MSIKAPSRKQLCKARMQNPISNHTLLQCRYNHYDIKFIINCDSINKKILCKVDKTIENLLLLNAGDTTYPDLLFRMKQISIYTDNTPISIMCRSHIQEITNFVTKILTFDPDMARAVVELFDMDLSQFINSNLRYALPYAITSIHSDDCLLGISSLLEIPIKELCESKASYIIVALLMESDAEIKSLGYNRLQKIFKSKEAAHKMLASNNATKITTKLAMNLGLRDLKDQALTALGEMKSLFGMASITISEYLSRFIFAILTKITKFISDKKVHNNDKNSYHSHEPHTLEALMEIMILMQSNIGDHALHVIQIAITTGNRIFTNTVFFSFIVDENFSSNQ